MIYVLEVNPRASRTVPFVTKATGIQLAKVAARCMVGQSLESAGHHQGSDAALLQREGSRVPVRQVPGRRHHPRPGDEVHRRSDGRGQDLRRSLRQDRSSAPAPSCRARRRGKVFLTVKNSDKPRAVEVARDLAAHGLRARRHQGHRRGHHRRRHRLRDRQQGDRRPSARRRHDQEQRDRAGHQHGGGASQRDRRLARRSAPRRCWRA